MDDFIIRPPIDIDIAQILDTMQSSRTLPILQILPGDNLESGIVFIDPSDITSSDELPCPDDYLDTIEN
jgi:hypothetical protein